MKWQVGDVTITKVVETTSTSLGAHILPNATVSALSTLDWLTPFLDQDQRMLISFHSLIVEMPERLVIVDTCIGNDKERNYPKWNRMQTSFREDLNEAGFHEDRFDTVLCTHMHVDHVGWNTVRRDDRWEATFPNARYLYAKAEWEHWRADEDEEFGPVVEDSVRPIFDAGLADLVESNHQVCAELALIPTPGHTPGHVSVVIESKGETAVITGDIFHRPCQIAYPEWRATADLDGDAAELTRRKFLGQYSNQPVLCIGTHFAGVTAGRIVSDGDTYRLDY